MPSPAPLQPVHLGRTPAGVEWVAYPHDTHTAETFARDLAEMREAFASVCRAQRAAAVPALLPTLASGQRIVVRSERVAGAGRAQEQSFTVRRVAPASTFAPAGWMVDLDGPSGGEALLVVRQARGTVALLGGRTERDVIELRVEDEMAVAS